MSALTVTPARRPGAPRHGDMHFSSALKTLIALMALRDESQLINKIELGIENRIINDLPRYLNISMTQLATLIDVNQRTLQRWAASDGSTSLSIGAGERAVRLITLRERATEVFEDADEGLAWLNEANDAFGGATPLDRAITDIGYHQVERLLTRIEQGVYS